MFCDFNSYFVLVSPRVLSPELSSVPLSRWHFPWDICQFDISWIIDHLVKIKELCVTHSLSLINQTSHHSYIIFLLKYSQISFFLSISLVQISLLYPWL